MFLLHKQRSGTRSPWLAFVTVAGAASLIAVLWTHRAPLTRDAAAIHLTNASDSANQRLASDAKPSDVDSMPAVLPASLAGSSAPHLRTDGRGRLAQAKAVRDFFDYFLTTQNEVSTTMLDALVRREIAAQLEGTPAANEADSVWQRYKAYRSALEQLPQTASATNKSSEKMDLDALQLSLDQLDALRARVMGDWSVPFFAAESLQQHTDLSRLRIAANASLSNMQKTARLAALDAALPLNFRAERERAHYQQAALDTISQAQMESGSSEALRAQITQMLGAEVAQRVVKMQKAENDWQARYTDYASQRALIDQRNLPPQQHEAQISHLRQQFFSRPSDAMRAASLDRDSGA